MYLQYEPWPNKLLTKSECFVTTWCKLQGTLITLYNNSFMVILNSLLWMEKILNGGEGK